MRGRATALTVRMGPLALVLLPLALYACGDGGGPAQISPKIARQFGSELDGPEARAAAGTLITYLGARAKREWARACSYLAEPVRRLAGRFAAGSKQVPGTVCASYVAFVAQKQSASGSPALDRVTVDSVRADGDRGFVLYEIFKSGERAMPIRHEGGYWKLTALNGIPIGTS